MRTRERMPSSSSSIGAAIVSSQVEVTEFQMSNGRPARPLRQSTSSASRAWASLPSIGTSNFYLEPGTTAPGQIVRGVKSGLYVTAMLGRGADVTVVEYLKTPYERTKLEQLLRDAGMTPKDALRTRGTDAEERGLPDADDETILNAMLEEEFTTESIILARNIVSSMQSRIGAESPNRGVKAEEWFVVRNARMPSVLVEAGFVTNPEEAAPLADEDYLRRLSEGIYNGVVDFVSYFENMKGVPAP